MHQRHYIRGMKYDVIVLGSGPGGYVTAIRASQLGLKTAVVEREALGGICLNWGCIPTKALLKSANVFEYIEHAEDYGISVAKPKADFGGMVNRSRGVADGMSKGVTFLMKKNNIDVIMGDGKLLPGKKLEVTAADGAKSTLEADHIIVATGARSRQLPSMPQDGEKIIGYREAMTLKKQPKKMVVVGSGAIGVEFVYFYNAFYMASLGLFLFAMGGFANQYFWPDSTGFANTSIPMLMSISSLAMTLFGRSFLEIPTNTIANKVLTGLALTSAGLFIMAFLLPYNRSIVLNTGIALLIIACLFIIGIIRWRQGYSPAKWYVVAWSGMLAGALIYSMAAFGYLADFLAREIFMQAAVGAQVILLNYAMVQRWRLLNKKLLDVEHNARTELELKVHERTAQLRSTMRELEKANRQLATLSLNDALTGLQIAVIWTTCCRNSVLKPDVLVNP